MLRYNLLVTTAIGIDPKKWINKPDGVEEVIELLERNWRTMRCSRPLLFNYGDGSPLSTWKSGTAFVVRYVCDGLYSREFVITAKHCLKSFKMPLNGCDLKKFWVLKSGSPSKKLGRNTLVPLLAHHPYSGYNPDNLFSDDDLDFEIFEVIPDSFKNEPDVFVIKAKSPELNEETVQKRMSQNGDFLAISGFPSKYNIIDYDTSGIVHHRMHLFGFYSSNNIGHFHGAVRFPTTFYIPDDMDGFSGAPVFGFRNSSPKLAGMVLRSTSQARIAHFISIELILMRLMSIDILTTSWFMTLKNEGFGQKNAVRKT